MNVAALELCQELYALTGWKPEGSPYWGKPGKGVWPLYSYEYAQKSVPAYDLGHLLRKLPEKIEGDLGVGKWFTLRPTANNGYWLAKYGKNQISCWGETPEDAACKLLIELLNRSLLK